jgi:site-specific recombinase XerC
MADKRAVAEALSALHGVPNRKIQKNWRGKWGAKVSEEVMKERRLNKTHVKFWEGKLFHPRTLSVTNAFPNWYVQMAHGGRQRQFSTGTPNRDEAAKRSREAYFLLKSQGWDAVLEKYGSKKRKMAMEQCVGKEMTVGEYVALLRKKCALKPATLNDYLRGFRKILSDVFEVRIGSQKYNSQKVNGDTAFAAKINAIKMKEITRDKIEQWKCEELRTKVAAGKSRDAASATINSKLRSGKALFSEKILEEVCLTEKIRSPFARIKKLKEGSHLYFSKFDPMKLLKAAESDLLGTDDDAFLAIVLALCQALRANEMDKLLWSQVDLREGKLSIYGTEYFTPKTRHSCGTIPISDAVMVYLKEIMGRRKNWKAGDFVINQSAKMKKNSMGREYRCKAVFKRVIKWLKDKGISDQKPLHTLRKECGSIVLRQTGDINATRLFLRDSSMAVVINHYADSTVIKAPKFNPCTFLCTCGHGLRPEF